MKKNHASPPRASMTSRVRIRSFIAQCLVVVVSGVASPWASGGGGSYPPGWNGWHLLSRRAASHEPRSAPKRSMHADAYREHEGSKRHTLPIKGDRVARYRRRSASRSHRIIAGLGPPL